jgi:hypothetical protein
VPHLLSENKAALEEKRKILNSHYNSFTAKTLGKIIRKNFSGGNFIPLRRIS